MRLLARGLVRQEVGDTRRRPCSPRAHTSPCVRRCCRRRRTASPFLYTVTQSSWWFSHTAQRSEARYLVIRSTAGLLTERAEAAGSALVFELTLTALAAAPGAGELPADADRLHHLEEAGAAAFAMLGQASLQVLAGAQIVLGAGRGDQSGAYVLQGMAALCDAQSYVT